MIDAIEHLWKRFFPAPDLDRIRRVNQRLNGERVTLGYIVPDLSWRQRLEYWLFPAGHCELPPAPTDSKDVIVSKVEFDLDWKDRVRLLASGRVSVEVRVVTENVVGRCFTHAVLYALPPERFDSNASTRREP